MTDSSKKDSGTLTSFTKTQIDLGEDLLEKTRTALVSPLERELTPENLRDAVEDQIQSAKILHGEGLTEEAKKILRQIMIADPGSVVARAMLSDIHKQELKQIFQPTPQRKRFNEQPNEEDLKDIDADQLMRGLDSDLVLGLYGPDGGEPLGAWQKLFGTQAAMDKYAAALERRLVDASLQDRLELGVGFLEMGLPELAARQFGLVTRRLAAQPESPPQMRLTAACLLAQAQIQCGRAYEATVSLHPKLQDPEIPREEKVELIYLMATAHERMGRPDEAMSWYQQALMIDASYRDVQERMSLIEKRAAREIKKRGDS